jgi:hypothetical protein
MRARREFRFLDLKMDGWHLWMQDCLTSGLKPFLL